mmetsp:Transcript_14825/g.62568  ORF Transcript_14825/g.62568 Transcript_14825/m.62568 type:complete len:376 (-) Transcript_14825:1513-2640(-)
MRAMTRKLEHPSLSPPSFVEARSKAPARRNAARSNRSARRFEGRRSPSFLMDRSPSRDRWKGAARKVKMHCAMVCDPSPRQKDHTRTSASASARSASVSLWLSVFLSSSRAKCMIPFANVCIATDRRSSSLYAYGSEGSPPTYATIAEPQNMTKDSAFGSEPGFSHAAAAARARIDAGPSPSTASLGATRKSRRTEKKYPRRTSFFVCMSSPVQANGARIRAASNTTLARFARISGSTLRATERSWTAQSPSVLSTELICVSCVKCHTSPNALSYARAACSTMDVPTSSPRVFAVSAHRLTVATTAVTLCIAQFGVSRESQPPTYARRKSLTFSSPFGVSIAARMSVSVANRSPAGRSRLRIRFASGRDAPHSLR